MAASVLTSLPSVSAFPLLSLQVQATYPADKLFIASLGQHLMPGEDKSAVTLYLAANHSLICRCCLLPDPLLRHVGRVLQLTGHACNWNLRGLD